MPDRVVATGQDLDACLPLDLESVYAAQRRLTGAVHRTPVLSSRTMDAVVGAAVLFKCESFQRTGSFKFRGAYNALASLSDAQRRQGVCAVSAGNHAQAVALAARELDITATILMPHDAPPAKLAAVSDYGGVVVTYDRYVFDQSELLAEYAAEHGLFPIHPFDDPIIAAGAGTAALELLEQADRLDTVVVPIGGGGAISGFATVFNELHPSVRIIGVQPEALPSTAASLAAGRRVTLEPKPHIADGQTLTSPGRWTFEIMRRLVDDVVTVSDAQLVTAMRFLFDRMKLVTEPSGAAGAAALLSKSLQLNPGERVAVLLSGGNVGVERFIELMTRTDVPGKQSGSRTQ